jgi:hypothetical protein
VVPRPPPELTLLAVTYFSAGDSGWLTPIGAIRDQDQTNPKRQAPDYVALVKALEDIQPGKHGLFIEVGPKADGT